MNTEKIILRGEISPELTHLRLDQALAKLFPQYSRSILQTWIQNGWVSIDGVISQKTREKVLLHQKINITAELPYDDRWEAQPIPLSILYQDDDLCIINKPAGLVVHPGAGVPDHTLVNALLYYDPQLATIPRAGIIHRLDKDTSGLLVVARNLSSHHDLTLQMKNRLIQREYEAIVKGVLLTSGQIEANIGRHPTQRTRMAVVSSGKPALTHYRVIQRFRAHTHIHVKLETGRTHQIRVHMDYIHHPVVGDPMYGKTVGIPAKLSAPLKATLTAFKRQALHAIALTLCHPTTHEILRWQSPLPDDMTALIQQLQEDAHEQKQLS